MADRHLRSIIHRIEHATVDALPNPQGAIMIVAVSGGADSAATLAALCQRAAAHEWRLHAAHLDHGIAPPSVRAAFRDTARTVACRLDVPFHIGAADVPARIAVHGGNLEAVARQLRYAFLHRLARELRARAVVTGHTEDDQAETVLLNLLRGSGLDGLSGMPASGPIPTDSPDGPAPKTRLIRPLLSTRRRETRDLCRHLDIPFVDDPANSDLTLRRNWLRVEILPKLAQTNPRIVSALATLADNLNADRDLLQRLTDQTLAELVQDRRTSEGSVLLSRRALRGRPIAIQRRVIRHCLQLAGAEIPSAERTRAVLRLLDRGGHRVECGHGVQAEARGDQLRIGIISST